jgi:hypothetical protein
MKLDLSLQDENEFEIVVRKILGPYRDEVIKYWRKLHN